MKCFEKDEDFNINPELFHTDLKFLDCEYFLSDHVDKEKYLVRCQKPPKLKLRSASLDLKIQTN